MPERAPDPTSHDFDRQLAGVMETLRARSAGAALEPTVRARTAGYIAAMQELVDTLENDQPDTGSAADQQTR